VRVGGVLALDTASDDVVEGPAGESGGVSFSWPSALEQHTVERDALDVRVDALVGLDEDALVAAVVELGDLDRVDARVPCGAAASAKLLRHENRLFKEREKGRTHRCASPTR